VRKYKILVASCRTANAATGMLVIISVLFSVSLVFAREAAAARIEPWNRQCLKDQKNWEKQAKHKAVAVTKVYSNGQGCAHSWNLATIELAKKEALLRCNLSLQKNRPKTKDKCILLMSK
jgi:hypothetical protein